MELRDGICIYDVARIIERGSKCQQYCGNTAAPQMMATKLGGKLKPKHETMRARIDPRPLKLLW